MNIGFLRSSASMDQLQAEMTALEKAGCDRIVVDSAQHDGRYEGMLEAVVSRLEAGDSLTVWSLDSVADSVPSLIELVLTLEERSIRFRSLQEGFDISGKARAPAKAVLQQLLDFHRLLRARAEANVSGRRAGRPRSLERNDVERARVLLKEGRRVDDVARELRVSRATLYRYLEQQEN